METIPAVSLSPSFNAHSSGTLADIAARVIEEFRNESHPDHNSNLFDWIEPDPDGDVLQFCETEHAQIGDFGEEGSDGEFEFAFVGGEANCSPISADELFHNGQIKPIYTFDFIPGAAGFGGGAITGGDAKPPKTTSSGRMSLRKLMVEDRDATTSCSSSEADDLESVPPGTYCVWAPNNRPEAVVGASGRRCKKSSSTGSSKRWKLRDLIHRSNSDGKDTFLFLSSSGKKPAADVKIADKETSAAKEIAGDSLKCAGSKETGEESLKCAAAAKERESASKTTKGGERKVSYRPYKQDLMGILANVNGLNRNLQPF